MGPTQRLPARTSLHTAPGRLERPWL